MKTPLAIEIPTVDDAVKLMVCIGLLSVMLWPAIWWTRATKNHWPYRGKR